jgi:hypothetical protein
VAIVKFAEDSFEGGFHRGIVEDKDAGENVEKAAARLGVAGGLDHD